MPIPICTLCVIFVAEGYARSESTIVFYIQRKEDAKRIYGTLEFCDTFFLGLNPHTMLAYEDDFLKISLNNIYANNNRQPDTWELSYIEMNANAVKVGNALFLLQFIGCFK